MLKIENKGDSQYFFVVQSAQGNPLFESEPFENQEAVKEAITALKPRIKHPGSFERLTDHEGHFRFALKDPKGKTLGRSKPYGSEAGMENGIRNTREGILDSSLG